MTLKQEEETGNDVEVGRRTGSDAEIGGFRR